MAETRGAQPPFAGLATSSSRRGPGPCAGAGGGHQSLAAGGGRGGAASAAPRRVQACWVALFAAGVDPFEVARLVGHTCVAFTYERYGHSLPEVDKAAGDKLAPSAASVLAVAIGTTGARGPSSHVQA